MMKTKLFLLLLLTLISYTVFAQTNLCDYATYFRDCRVEQDFSTSVYAGEKNCQIIYFENSYNKPTPIYVRLIIDSESNISTNEINITSYLTSNGNNYTLNCFSNQVSENKIEFFCYNATVLGNSRNNLVTCLVTHPAFSPTTMNITTYLYSDPGIVSNSSNYTLENNETIKFENIEIYPTIYITPVSLNIIKYSEVFIKPPSDNHYGLYFFEIDTNLSENDSLLVRVYYDINLISDLRLRESEIKIYRFDETQGKWIQLNTIVNTIGKYVEARVSGGGIYSIYAPRIPSYLLWYPPTYPPTNITTNVTTEEQNITQENITINQTIPETVPEEEIKPIVTPPEEAPKVEETTPPSMPENITAPVCGNNICEEGENYINCPEDCPRPEQNVTEEIQIPKPVIAPEIIAIVASVIALVIIAIIILLRI